MGHVLHIGIVNACGGEQACQRALREMEGYGTEDNWMHPIGAVCEDGMLYKDPGYDTPADAPLTLAGLAKFAQGLFPDAPSEEHRRQFRQHMRSLERDEASVTVEELRMMRDYIDLLMDIRHTAIRFGGNPPTSVFEFEYNQGLYDEEGITELDAPENAKPGQKRWAVLMDVHR